MSTKTTEGKCEKHENGRRDEQGCIQCGNEAWVARWADRAPPATERAEAEAVPCADGIYDGGHPETCPCAETERAEAKETNLPVGIKHAEALAGCHEHCAFIGSATTATVIHNDACPKVAPSPALPERARCPDCDSETRTRDGMTTCPRCGPLPERPRMTEEAVRPPDLELGYCYGSECNSEGRTWDEPMIICGWMMDEGMRIESAAREREQAAYDKALAHYLKGMEEYRTTTEAALQA